jgi:hypothetical protein
MSPTLSANQFLIRKPHPLQAEIVPIDSQVCRQRNQTALLKTAREGILRPGVSEPFQIIEKVLSYPSAGSQAMRVTHLDGIAVARW